jgi:probable F420-dependent oxidoreductase
LKIGILFTNTGVCGTPEGAAALAEAAEKYEIESLWTAEHVVFPVDMKSPYPYSPDGAMPTTGDMPVPDPLIWMAWVAARTTRVKLATGILILPERNPLVVAKEAATLDLFCQGRLMLGVGVGWLREEYEALGVPWEGRGRRLDEYVEALRVLWRETEPTYHGETVSFKKARMYPKPFRGDIPIVIGGDSPVAARRAALTGDGFFPARMNVLPEIMPILRKTAEEAGRNPDDIEVTTLAFPTPGCQSFLEDNGVHRMAFIPPNGEVGDIGPDIERMLSALNAG